MDIQDTDRYDVATMKVLAANLAAFYHGLVENGMTEEDALTVLLEYISALLTPRP